MGKCSICGEKAGFFENTHAECIEERKLAKANLALLVVRAFRGELDVSQMREQADELARRGYLEKSEAFQSVVNGYETAIDNALADKNLTLEEETMLLKIHDEFSDVLGSFDAGPHQEKLVKAAIIRDSKNGKISSRVNISGNLPILFDKSEVLLWVFKNCNYYEIRTKTEYVGGSAGISFKLISGVYLRTGSNKGEKIQTSNVVHADVGFLAITDKNVHFKGAERAIKIPVKKLLSLDMLSDGITLYKDSANPKPQSFTLDDPWFAANLISSLR